ncbi:MAG: sulfotransferase, partial [Planctomycetota bacterium]|nr:sulfotransferase [Planctomycetota bacterium]
MSQPLSMPPPASTRPRMLQRAQRALEARRVGAARELALWALSRRGGRDLNCFLLLAECALAEGELGQLERWGRAALALEPEHVAPYEPLARAGCVASPELRTLLERRDWPAGRRVRLEFALGHALDREGDHAGAFAAWEAANRRARVSFDPLAFQINLALSHAPLHLTGAGDPSLCPLLLIGVPRSGSSLAEQILAAHPDVQGLGERGVMGRLSARRGD